LGERSQQAKADDGCENECFCSSHKVLILIIWSNVNRPAWEIAWHREGSFSGTKAVRTMKACFLFN
jgi:hypothetical protein